MNIFEILYEICQIAIIVANGYMTYHLDKQRKKLIKIEKELDKEKDDVNKVIKVANGIIMMHKEEYLN